MSQDELVEVVDEEGNILTVVSKKEAHEKGLLHKTVIAEVIDSQGRWLMAKQSASKQDKGQYVSAVGGHVTSGETDLEALQKEAREEIGLTQDFKYEFVDKKVHYREVLGRKENHLFLVYKIFSDIEPVTNDEIESCTRFTEEELKRELKENPQLFGINFHFVIKNFFPELLE